MIAVYVVFVRDARFAAWTRDLGDWKVAWQLSCVFGVGTVRDAMDASVKFGGA